MARKLFRYLSFFLCLAGIILLAGPYVKDYFFLKETDAAVEGFKTAMKPHIDTVESCDSSECVDIQNKEENVLYGQMKAYNGRIYSEQQSGITDAESFEALPPELKAFGSDAIGYVEIPSIDVKLPLFIGTTEENLNRGAAILANTSMPIGGINTNCVIAGHRGYYSSKYFKDIEKIKTGDKVIVANSWEERIYTVVGFDIIDPTDSDAIKIEEGRELVTLLTCHPYRSNGRYRYIVFCEPESIAVADIQDGVQDIPMGTVHEDGNSMEGSDGTVFESSQNDIRNESMLRKIAIFAIVAVLCLNMAMAMRDWLDGLDKT